ncbi:MAG: YraN family protein [Bosea sp. (in: a-proteobacteria)]
MARRDTASARRSVTSGFAAEWLAIAFLTCKGYRLLARRYGGKGGEIDLIARRGSVVIFVEVKARAVMDDAATAITHEKKRLVNRRIRDWSARNPWSARLTLRADAIFFGGGLWPRHIENVFPVEML